MACAAIRPAIRSAIGKAIVEAFCAPMTRSNLLALLFPITAPGVTAPGYYFDFSDLTEEKLAWRKNQLTYTEQFDNAVWAKSNAGVASLPVVTPAYSVAPNGAMTAQRLQMTLNGGTSSADYATIHQFFQTQIGRVSSHGLWLKTNDGTTKVVTYRDDNAQTVNMQITVTPVWQRFMALNGTAATTGLNACRLWLRGGQGTANTVDLSIWGAQLNPGATLLDYQALTDVSTEFLAAYPYHSLFRDSTCTTACYQLEDPLGGALDLRLGGARSPTELVTVPTKPGLPAGGGTRFYAVTMFAMVASKSYEIFYTISNYSGTGNVGLAGASPAGVIQMNHTANGSYRCVQTPTANGQLAFYTSNTNTADFSGISVKELYGNHATQATTGDRPSISAKYNQLTNSAWQGGGSAPTGWLWAFSTGVSAPNGMIDGNVVYRQTANNERPFLQTTGTFPLTGTGQITLSLEVGQIYSGSVRMDGLVLYNTAVSITIQYYVNGVPVAASAFVTPNSKVQLVISYTGASGTMAARFGAGTSGAVTVDMDMSRPLVSYGGLDQVPRYQRTHADGTYDYVGFPSFARFNGINQSLSGNVDLSASDKVLWAATARKETDSAVAAATLNELTATYNTTAGAFVLFAPAAQNTPEWRFGYNIAGTGGARTKQALGYPAPVSSVLSMGIDAAQAGDQMVARVNAAPIAVAATNSGAGNFASAAFHIGRRNGTTNPFNGAVHRLAARGGTWDGSALSVAERLVNERTKWATA